MPGLAAPGAQAQQLHQLQVQQSLRSGAATAAQVQQLVAQQATLQQQAQQAVLPDGSLQLPVVPRGPVAPQQLVQPPVAA
eukprot:15135656-Alexandrium_andersonii.AAC.1